MKYASEVMAETGGVNLGCRVGVALEFGTLLMTLGVTIFGDGFGDFRSSVLSLSSNSKGWQGESLSEDWASESSSQSKPRPMEVTFQLLPTEAAR